MTATETIKLNKMIGKALIETAHEAYSKRIEAMKTRPFEEVIKSIKTYKETKNNKANGYFASDALRYFDEKLENECIAIWSEIDDTMNDDWFNAIEQFGW